MKKVNISNMADHMLIGVSEGAEAPVVFYFHVQNAWLAAGVRTWVCST